MLKNSDLSKLFKEAVQQQRDPSREWSVQLAAQVSGSGHFPGVKPASQCN